MRSDVIGRLGRVFASRDFVQYLRSHREVVANAAHAGFHRGGVLGHEPGLIFGTELGQFFVGTVLRDRVGDIFQMITGTLQVTGEGVVVCRRDGVEFMIVATRAAHRQA